MLIQKNHVDYLLNLLFETQCLLCKLESKNVICEKCIKKFRKRHNHTKKLNNLTVYSWGVYSGTLRDSILKLKSENSEVGLILGDILSKFIKTTNGENSKSSLIVQVPSHKNRIKKRGYCHTSIIARQVSKNLNLNFSDKKLVRVKETKFMNELKNIKEREKNIQNAFKLSEEISEKRIIIIDDIITSGHTFNEIAKVIKEKYTNKEIIGFTVASGDKY